MIARRSPLDPLFAGLPVVLVGDWDELRDAKRLADWRRRYAPLTDRALVWRRLRAEAWLAPIRAAVTANGAPGIATVEPS